MHIPLESSWSSSLSVSHWSAKSSGLSTLRGVSGILSLKFIFKREISITPSTLSSSCFLYVFFMSSLCFHQMKVSLTDAHTERHSQRQRQRQIGSHLSTWIHCDAHLDAWEWVLDQFWSVTMYSNWPLLLTLPLPLTLILGGFIPLEFLTDLNVFIRLLVFPVASMIEDLPVWMYTLISFGSSIICSFSFRIIMMGFFLSTTTVW